MAERALRLIDEQGEVIDTSSAGLESEVQKLRDHIKGLERNLAGWTHRCAELERDHQAEAEAHKLWPVAVRLFVYWQKVLDHPRAEWTWKRFDLCLPYLKGKNYGLEPCLRAICGRKADSWWVEKGLTMWEDIFSDQGHFEKSLARCPKSWTLPPGAEEFVAEKANGPPS